MTWSFEFDPRETPGERIARCAYEALRDGPMGDKQRGAFYREFIACGFSPALLPPFDGADIGAVRTSCGVFVRGLLHASGRRALKPGKVGGALVGGWLEDLSFHHPAWVWADDAVPEPGAVFYRDYGTGGRGWSPTASGHVGVFVERHDSGLWITAEGGGGDGTTCRLSQPKDVRARDSLNRNLIGWWRPSLLGLADTMAPQPPKPEPIPEPEHETIRRGSHGYAVRVWQGILGLRQDGIFGPITESGTKAWQAQHGLVADGIVGPKTWAMATREKADTDPAPPPEVPCG